MEAEKISKALDNSQNEIFLNLSTKKIRKQKLKVIHNLGFPIEIIKILMDKLKDYRYVDEINHLKRGVYIRWFDLKNSENLNLQRGGTISDIKITETCTLIACRNNYGNSHFHIKMDECLIFQKITDEEKIILSAMDYLE